MTLQDPGKGLGEKLLENREPLHQVEKMALYTILTDDWAINESAEIEAVTMDEVNEVRLNENLLNKALRHYIYHHLNSSYGSHKTDTGNAALYNVIKHYYPHDVDVIKDHFEQKAEKRIVRSDDRISKLKEQLKAEKPTAKKTAKTTAKKKQTA